MRAFVAWQRDQRHRTPHTLYTYATTLETFVCHVGATSLDRVPLVTIETWLQRPRQGRAHGGAGAAATISKEIAMLRTFYRWLHARGEIGANPCELLAAPAVRNVQPKPIPDDDWRALWDAGDDVERVMLGLGFYGGLRRAEMTMLRGLHVDVARLRLVGFVRKGGGDDVLPLATMLDVFEQRLPHVFSRGFEEQLRALAAGRSGSAYLLPWADAMPAPARSRRLGGLADDQLDPQHLNSVMARLSRRAGVRHYTPHQLRRSTASNLLRAGVPLAIASRLMNHANVQTTMRYVRAGGDELAQWLRGA